jgi:hypothetical protein
MDVEITYNKFNYYGKIIFELVLIFLIVLITSVTITSWHFYNSNGHLPPIFLISFLLVLGIYMLLNLIYIPIGISINKELNQFHIKYPFTNIQFSVDEINGYTTTIVITKSSRDDGVLIHLKNGKEILLSDHNLKDYKPILEYLQQSKVPYLGKERYRLKSLITKKISN